jgi:hypothetical protein
VPEGIIGQSDDIEAPLDNPNDIQITIKIIGIVFPIDPNAFALT